MYLGFLSENIYYKRLKLLIDILNNMIYLPLLMISADTYTIHEYIVMLLMF
jgi:hypothetical protein